MALTLFTFLSGFTAFRLRKALARYHTDPSELDAVKAMRLMLRLGRGDEAFRLAREAKRVFPSSAGIRAGYQAVRRYQAAAGLKATSRLLKQDPQLDHFLRAADFCRTLDRFEKAHRHLENAARFFPDHWAIHLAQGKLHFSRFKATGKPEDGLSCLQSLRSAHALNPDNYQTLLFLAITNSQLGYLQDSKHVVDLILKGIPTDPKALEIKAHIERAMAAARALPAAIAELSAHVLHQGASPPYDETRELLEHLRSLEGVVGVFLFESDGTIGFSSSLESTTFTFAESLDVITSIVAECQFEARQLGIGDLSSCFLRGETWQIYLRSLATQSLILFRDSTLCSEALDVEVDAVVSEVPAV